MVAKVLCTLYCFSFINIVSFLLRSTFDSIGLLSPIRT